MLLALLVPMMLAMIGFALILLRAVISRRAVPTFEGVVLGAITNFFDTLGIGSFAPTTAWFKFRKLVPDRLIPPTMLVGHGLPTMAQSVIFLILLGVMVDPVLLVGCTIAVLMGGLLGVPLVARARVWVVQVIVAVALLVGAAIYALTNLGMMPGGGTAASLPMTMTIIAITANFLFGVLLNFGVGNYAPTLIMFSLMGMDPRLVFPIMASGASLTVAGAGARHIGIGQINLKIAAGVTLGGIPAVLLAAFMVKTMNLVVLRWLVFVVVLYAAAIMLRSALGDTDEGKVPAEAKLLAG